MPTSTNPCRAATRRTRAAAPLAAWAAALLAAADPAGAVNLTVTVNDSAGKPLENAVVAVFVKGTPAVAQNAQADLAQRNKTFQPGVLAIQTGTAVRFPNFDTVRHHVYSFSPVKTFELKLYAGTPAAPVVFDKPGTAVLGCNIHDTMSAFVHVVDTPYFGKTDAAGRVTLDVPAGEHKAQAWHPLLGAEAAPQAQTLKGGGAPVVITLKTGA